jgi:hypothetical protein
MEPYAYWIVVATSRSGFDGSTHIYVVKSTYVISTSSEEFCGVPDSAYAAIHHSKD